MISLDDCKLPDGSTDWKRYDELKRQEFADRKAKGELCQLCGRLIIWSKGHPQTCTACQDLDKSEELHHSSSVRCPYCGHHWDVGDSDDYDLYKEGQHDVTCSRCEKDFEVSTSVTYTFQSPERVKEKDQE